MTYTNATFHYRISAPDSCWTLKEETGGGTATLTMASDEDESVFTLTGMGVPPGTRGQHLLKGILIAMAQRDPEDKLVENGDIEIAGRKAAKAISSRSGEDGYTAEIILLVDGTAGYVFTWAAPDERFARLDPTLKKILGSFEIVESPGK